MRSRASESVRVGTLWNSPNLSSMPASSSPVGFSRWRDVDDRAAIFGCKNDRRCRRCLTGPDKIRSYGASERLIEALSLGVSYYPYSVSVVLTDMGLQPNCIRFIKTHLKVCTDMRKVGLVL